MRLSGKGQAPCNGAPRRVIPGLWESDTEITRFERDDTKGEIPGAARTEVAGRVALFNR